MCSDCMGSGFVKVGTGHRNQGYPFAERQASELCDCDFGQQIQQEDRRTIFSGDALLQVAERNRDEEMRAAGKSPCVASWCTSWTGHESGMCDHCRELRRWRDE